MIRTQLYIPEALYAHAKAMAELKGMNISEYMRESLREHIATERSKQGKTRKKGKCYDPLAGIAGKFGKNWKPSNVALTHDDIYDL